MVHVVRVLGLSPRKMDTCLIAGLMMANLFMLLSEGSALSHIGSLLLFCVVPGLSLVNLVFSGSSRLGLLPRLLLGVAMSYVVSNLLVLWLSLMPGGMSLTQVVLGLDIVSLLFVGATRVLNGGDFAPRGEAGSRGAWIYVVILLLLLFVFRFVGLDFSFEGRDEMPVVSLATGLIEGKASVLLDQKKGPSQVTTAAAFILFDGGYDEFVLRVPFALASLVSVLVAYLLGREMFSDRIGLLGGLLLALNGNYLAWSRSIQYQPLVLMMAVASAYCVWCAGNVKAEAGRRSYILLGSAFFGFGCLTHYGGIIVAPALALLYLCQQRPSWKRELPLVVICALVILAMVSLYYVPFFFAGQHAAHRAFYFSSRLGWDKGVFNNFQELLSSMMFVNSVYYVAFMWLTLTGAIFVLWKAVRRPRAPVLIAGSSFVFGLFVSFVWPGLVQVGTVNLAVVLFVPMLGLVILGKGLPLESRAMWLWLMTGLTILGFFSHRPHTHWYVVAAPWALLSAVAVDWAMTAIEGRLRPSIKSAVWVPLAIVVVLFGGYLYMFYLQEVPAYAMNFPKYKSQVYWTPQNELTREMRAFLMRGTPNESGWEVIGGLYRLGILRGHLRAHGIGEREKWYMGHEWDVDNDSRYALYSGVKAVGYSREEIEQWYDLAGRVLVHGAPKIWIYERKDVAAANEPVADYRLEAFKPLYRRMASLSERLRLDEVGVGKKTSYREAGLVEAMSKPGDEIVFTEPEQVGPFSYHYTGDLPYHIPERAMKPEDLEKWLQAWEGTGKAYIVYWTADKNGEQVKWDDRLANNDGIKENAWHSNVGLAVYSESEEVGLHLLEESRLGDSIELLGYEARYDERNGAVQLVLHWAMEEYVWKDYTVFTHLLDGDGNQVGQKDNPPGRGLMPTSMWRTDKVVRDDYEMPIGEADPAEYWIEVGMYDAATGERLPASGEGALPDGRIRLPLPVTVSGSAAEREG